MQYERYMPADSTPEEFAARLEAVKPARWRGRGELISLPWSPPVRGPVLFIDLWSGYSGAAIALLSLGVKCYVLAAECNPDVVKMAEASIDQIVHVPTVECVSARMLEGHHQTAHYPVHPGRRREPLPGQHVPEQGTKGTSGC